MYGWKWLIYKGLSFSEGQWNGMIAGFAGPGEYRYYHSKDTLTQKLGWVHCWVHDETIDELNT